MHNYFISIFLNHSIVIAALIGIVRFKKVIHSFYPVLFIVWLGLINETLSLVIIYATWNNALNSNIFVLLEYGLILLQFYKWNGTEAKKYYAVGCIGLVIWVTDNFLMNTIHQNNSLFRAFYSFVVVLFAINQVNKILIYEKGPLLKNAMFIFCVTFLFYYGCKAFVESFNAFHLGFSSLFLWNLWIILYFVNAIANLVYALAILCIPTRQEFTLPY